MYINMLINSNPNYELPTASAWTFFCCFHSLLSTLRFEALWCFPLTLFLSIWHSHQLSIGYIFGIKWKQELKMFPWLPQLIMTESKMYLFDINRWKLNKCQDLVWSPTFFHYFLFWHRKLPKLSFYNFS